MAIDNSFLLQQIIQEQAKTNDNLTAMREILADSLKVQQKIAKKKGGTGGNDDDNGGGRPNPPPRPPAGGSGGQGSKFFKNLFGEMKNFSRTALGNSATAANVAGSLGTSITSVAGSLKSIPGPVGAAATAFTLVADVGMKVYDYMNEQLTMYNQLNSAGLTLRDGMLTARAASAKSYMSLNEFSNALEKNSDAVAAMDGQYGDGVQNFSDLLGSVQQLQKVNGLYGVSQQTLADLAAKNFKYEKIYSSQDALRNINQQQSTAEFVGQMTYLSKTVGKSVDELLGKFDSMGDTLDSTVSQFAMTDNWGMDADHAAEVTKSMNSVWASMGETGTILSKINASRLSLFSLPDEYNNQFMQSYADMLEQLQREGITDSKVIRERIHEFTVSRQDDLNLELIAQQRSGNIQAAALLTQIRNQEKLFNQSNTKTNAQLEQYTNNFNMWISETFTQPFNEMYTKLQLSTMKYLSDMVDKSDGAFDFLANIVSDGFTYFNSSMRDLFGGLIDIPSEILSTVLGEQFDKVKASFNNMMGELVQLPIRIGSLIWDWLTGSDMDKSKEQLQGSVHNVFSGFSKFWDSLGDMKFNYSDMKSRISTAFESMKQSMSGWWDTAKSWFSDESPVPRDDDIKKHTQSATINTNTNQAQQAVVAQNKPQQPPVIAEPPKKMPERISEEAKKKESDDNSTPVQPPLINYDESILATLKAIASTLDSSNSNNQQTAQLLRQISENTESTRQT